MKDCDDFYFCGSVIYVFLNGVPWKLRNTGMMTRHDLKLWHLVQVVLLAFFHVNEASRHVMMLMHQQHIDEATAWLSPPLSQANADICIMCYLISWFDVSEGIVRACASSAAVRPGFAHGRSKLWARQCGLLTDTSCSHGGIGCFCAAAVICREGNRNFEASAMQDFERMFIERKSK